MHTGTREPAGIRNGALSFLDTSVQVAPEMPGAVRCGSGGDLLGTGWERTSLSGATQGDVPPSGHQALLAQLALPKSPRDPELLGFDTAPGCTLVAALTVSVERQDEGEGLHTDREQV